MVVTLKTLETVENGRLYHSKLGLERETRVELATLCLGSLCRAFRIYPKLQMPNLARLGPLPTNVLTFCFRMVRRL